MKTVFRNRLLLVIFLLLVLISVYFLYSGNRNQEWVAEWLENPICQPPCWAGITPGVNDIESAKAILDQNAKIKVVYSGDSHLEWEIDGDSGIAYVDPSTSKYISRIGFDFRKPRLTISQVIAGYGTPTRVQIGDCQDQCSTIVFFDNMNMIIGLYLFRINHDEEVEIYPSSKIVGLYFYSEEMISFPETFLFTFRYSKPVAWKGYGIYP